MAKVSVKWAVGITTVPGRRETLFPTTLRSIRAAGFPDPWLFVDGEDPRHFYERYNQLGVAGMTNHSPPLRIAGNWVLALWELYVRNPTADRFAIFQDDCLCVSNLRPYLDSLPYPDGVYSHKGQPAYLNLYTAPSNQVLADPGHVGFYRSNQLGKGAVALVFSRQAVVALLASDHLVQRPLDLDRGWRLIDGGIVDSMRKAGWSEHVHNPSLVKHVGKTRSFHSQDGAPAGTNGRRAMEWDDHYDSTTFPGEDFDALSLLDVKTVVMY